MYIRLDENNIVQEIIPDIDSALPGVSIEERYPADFVSQLMYVDDSTEVEQNYVYDEETGTFSEPPEPEYVEPEPTAEELIDIMLGVTE